MCVCAGMHCFALCVELFVGLSGLGCDDGHAFGPFRALLERGPMNCRRQIAQPAVESVSETTWMGSG